MGDLQNAMSQELGGIGTTVETLASRLAEVDARMAELESTPQTSDDTGFADALEALRSDLKSWQAEAERLRAENTALASTLAERDAALAERDGNGPAQVQVTLDIDALDADASGYEPVWQDGRKVGFVTSGAYGHHTGRSLAMALVDRDMAAPGTALSVHVVGVERPARVIAPSPYDPEGRAMRA